MKVVHLSTRDARGGAARSAHRLHRGLRAVGIDSRMLVRDRFGDDPSVVAAPTPDTREERARRAERRSAIGRDFTAYAGTRPAGLERFSDDRTEWGEALVGELSGCDVATLHWVAGLLDYAAVLPAVARRVPLVWSLYDQGPLTGGCHYDRGCGRFASACGACPQLGSTDPGDLSRAIWERKRKVGEEIPAQRLHFVAASRWLAGEVARSSWGGHPAHVIPAAVDTATFEPRDRGAARRRLSIPERARVVLFAATSLGNERKGLSFLLRALADLDARDLLLVAVGHGVPPEAPRVPWLRLGRVEDDDRLVDAYAAADLMALPSLQENLPTTGIEALACGTPLVGFATGGIPDLVEPGVTGALVPTGDVRGLARALRALLASERLPAMRVEARRRALREHALEVGASRYARLYADLVP